MFLPMYSGLVKKPPCLSQDGFDFILITGDAYVDHPSFGAAVISRVLESNGYSVSIISQPDWKSLNDFTVFGKPKLGFLITSGNLDSMVNHYTVAKKLRSSDSYSPGGRMGLRPDRAVNVYGNKVREAYPDSIIIIGGLEASLRRLAHYDYWSNKVRRSVLLDSSADILVYGMGERAIIDIAKDLSQNGTLTDFRIPGTVVKSKSVEEVEELDYIRLPSYQQITENAKAFCESFVLQEQNTDYISGSGLIEEYVKFSGKKASSVYVVQNPPSKPLFTKELDKVYSLKYMRTYHPDYEPFGGVPAITEVEFSLISNRGCFGSCNFCALGFHQGRTVTSRSHQSLLAEAQKLSHLPNFKGYIHDVGGPTANFRQASCKKQLTEGVCKNRKCLYPSPCKQLIADHSDYLNLLRKLRQIPFVKKVFVRSGIRFDYILHDKNGDEFLKELCEHHISGQLKVAPEHICDEVLSVMGKPSNGVYEKFAKRYEEINKKLGKKQFLVPYLMSSHPGSTMQSAKKLAAYLREKRKTPQQVQDFYPTPGTASTCMYYTGLNPYTKKPVYVAKSMNEKAAQRALMQEKIFRKKNM